MSVVATATSGLPVTLTVETQDVCALSGGSDLVMTAPGACKIKATQPGNAEWQAADPAYAVVAVSCARHDPQNRRCGATGPPAV